MSPAVDQLVSAARDAQRAAYAPYSRFCVGAAICDQQGRIHIGCNVENSSYGLTVCAERNAVAAGVLNGLRRIAMLAVVSPGGVVPCGACRQVLAEFADDFSVIAVDSEAADPSSRSMRRWLLSELFPYRFKLDEDA